MYKNKKMTIIIIYEADIRGKKRSKRERKEEDKIKRLS
jgi:hypothetical protein